MREGGAPPSGPVEELALRNVLIIGFHYPDTHMGAVRMRRIVRWLPRHGWEPLVLTRACSPEQARRLPPAVPYAEAAAPDLTEIYARIRRFGRQPVIPPTGPPSLRARSFRLTALINRWLMVPDKCASWYGPALRRGRQLMRTRKFDCIFASLEPRTGLLVAARLSRETGVPCVVEYRDLWTGNPYYHVTQPTPFHRWLHQRLERKVLRQAGRVSAVCRGIADYLAQEYAPLLKHPVALNHNFFDPEEYPPRETPAPGRPFTISYLGAMYGNRSPENFLAGLALFVRRARLSPSQFRFRWAGSITGIDRLEESLDRTGARDYIDFLGQLPHAQALRELLASHATLLIQAPHDTIHIPGKLFEALGARVPMLALAHPCEVTEIIERCRGGLIRAHDPEGIASALAELNEFASSGRAWDFAETEVRRFAADPAVGQLARLFDEARVSP